MRYKLNVCCILNCIFFLFKGACKGWDIHANGGAGRIETSWSKPATDYTYIVAYNSTPDAINIDITNSTAVSLEYLDVNTKYSVYVLALPLKRADKKWYFCTKNVLTTQGKLNEKTKQLSFLLY